MRALRLLRAVMVGAAVAMLADVWRSIIACVLLILAFICTDYIAERHVEALAKDAAARLRTRLGGLR